MNREEIEIRVDKFIELLLDDQIARIKLKSFKTTITKASLNDDPAQRELMIATVEENRPFTVMVV
jgi:hypothetical protein